MRDNNNTVTYALFGLMLVIGFFSIKDEISLPGVNVQEIQQQVSERAPDMPRANVSLHGVLPATIAQKVNDGGVLSFVINVNADGYNGVDSQTTSLEVGQSTFDAFQEGQTVNVRVAVSVLTGKIVAERIE